MSPEAPRTRAQQLAESIEQMIKTRGLSHGDPLGTLQEWRDETGYARSTVSEAMRVMIDRGTVEIRPGRGGGIFVTSHNPVVRLRHTLLTVRSEPSTVEDAIAIRDALEPLVDRDAALHRSATDIAEIEVALAALDAARGDADAFMRANWALHERIAQASPNVMLKAVYISMTSVIADLASHADADASDTTEHYFARRYEVHRALVAAIASGDADAVMTAVRDHSR